MELRIEREKFTQVSTIGKLYIDGAFECVTLEPAVRPDGIKVWGKTAIPEGRYRVRMESSARFGRLTPHVLGVPGFEGIEMHVGNYPKDTEGCTLLGRVPAPDCIYDSGPAVEQLYRKLEAYLATEGAEVWATYENCPEPGQQIPLAMGAQV